jgi:hypothetical protein
MKRSTVALIALALAASAIGHVRGDMPSTQSGQWTPSGALSGVRAGAASVLLPGGGVLMTGGSGADGATATVDLFGDSGAFSAMPAMTTARTEHAAVVLVDGRALVIGGRNADGAVASVEAYADGAWTTVGSLADARWGLTATLLIDGRVLVAGGENATGPVATVETFDPATGQWTVAGTMTSPRTGHAAARLADGRVLLAGGFSGDTVVSSIDVFDPASGTVTAGPSLSVARAGLSATTLLDGRVLFAGGNDGSNDLASAEVFNPATGAVSSAASALVARRDHLAFLLPGNNTVLIAGGVSGAETASAEIYVPWANQFWPTGSMSEPRSNTTGVVLAKAGVLLVAGGEGRASSELYGFATLATDKDDYAPGESVTMFGSGWQPGETVTLALREVPQEHASRFFTAVVDDSGRFINTDFVVEPHHLGVRFYLTASGAASQAQITFTDAFSVQTVVVGTQSPNPVIAGNPATYNVSVSFNGNNQTPCTAVLSVAGLPTNATGSFSSSSITSNNGTSTLTITTTGVAPNPAPNPIYNFTVTATMNPVGDGCRDTNATGNGTLRINAATATTTGVTSSQNPSVYGDAVSFTATVTPATGTTPPTGTVQFKIDGVDFGSPVALSASGSNGVATGGALSTLTATSHSVTAVYTPSGSFSGSTGTFTQDVSKRPASVTPAAASKEYGAADPTFTGTLSGFVAADSVTATYSRTAGETVAGSPYTISAVLAPAGVLGNYNITSNTANFTITTRALTVTAEAKTKVYGNADPALTYQVTSGALVSGDAFTGSLTRNAGEAVGSYAILQGTLSAGSNYAITYVGANLSITARPVTVTAHGKTKVYGDADPALTYQVTAGSLAFSDAFSGALVRDAGESVASYAIKQGTLALSANYNLTFVGANLSITARPVTVTADPKTKVYGDADPALTYQITSGSLAFSDGFSGALTRAAGDNVGDYAIQQGTLTLGPNYDLTFVGANLSITARPVTVTADGKTKVYGDADPALTYQITSGNLVNGDTFSGGLNRDAGESVGSYAITQGTLALSANYALTFVGANLSITARPVTVTADGKTKVYGDADPALTYQITSGNLVNGDTFGGGLARDAGESVGSYAITQGTLALSANYDLTFVGANVSITARPVTVTADPQSKVYGEADPALTYHITSGTLVAPDTFSGALTRVAGENVGPYAIQKGTLALSANYDLTFVGANLSITQRPVTGHITVDNKVYDGNTTATILTRTLDNVVSEDDVALTGGSATFADKNAGVGKVVSGTGFSLTGGDAGNYMLSASPISTTASIDRRTLHVSASGHNKVYDGNAIAGVTISDDRVSGDVLTIGYASAVFANKHVGINKSVSVTGITVGGADAGNYNANPSATTAADITTRPLTVSAVGQDKVYDGNALATVTLSDNRVTGDTFATSYAAASFSDKNVGIGKTVTVTGIAVSGPDAGNYSFNTSATTSATISARGLTVAADDKSKIFGNPDPPLTYQLTGGSLVAGDALVGALTRVAGENVGHYQIQQGTLTAGGNYAITFVPAMLTIGSWNVTGFYTPVTMSPPATPVYNTIKGGQTVPLKFNIYAGSVERTSVNDVLGFALQSMACLTGVEDPVEELTTTGGTALRYDTTGHQFIQNWQTPKGANACYKVTMTAQDGSKISAYFKTK